MIVSQSRSAGTIKNIDVTAEQAYSYIRLVQYFMRAFPKLKIIGHNQTTISGGSGKSCPLFDPVEFGRQLGYADRTWNKHICDYTNEEKSIFLRFRSRG